MHQPEVRNGRHSSKGRKIAQANRTEHKSIVPSHTTFGAMEYRPSFDLSPEEEGGTRVGSQDSIGGTSPTHPCPQKRCQMKRLIRPSLENLLNVYSVAKSSEQGSHAWRRNNDSSFLDHRKFYPRGNDVAFTGSVEETLMRTSDRQGAGIPKPGEIHDGSEGEDTVWLGTAMWSSRASSWSTCQVRMSTCGAFEKLNRDCPRSATASDLMCRDLHVQELRNGKHHNGKPALGANPDCLHGKSENVGEVNPNIQPLLETG